MAIYRVALILTLVPSCLTENVSYENYKVYRVFTKTADEARILANFEKMKNVDVWNRRHVPGNPVDIMVSPAVQFAFTLSMTLQNIKYSEIITDVNKVFKQEKLRQKSAKSSLKYGNFALDKYNRYSSIKSYLKQLVKDHADIVKVEYPGTSFEGRAIPMIKISTGGADKPIILIDAGIHAREWIAPATALYIISQLVEKPENRYMIEKVDWHIIPLLNPDGYEYSHESDRLWRKTRSSGKYCKGVDPNRNFEFHWLEVGASNCECEEDYAGASPMSEPEVQTLAKVVKQGGSRIKLYLTFHSYGNYILYPWGYTSDLPENADDLQALGEQVAIAIQSVNGTNYTIGSSNNVVYAAAGGSDDWTKAKGGVELSYTLELPGGGSLGFDPPASDIAPIGKETFEGIKIYHQYILQTFGQ